MNKEYVCKECEANCKFSSSSIRKKEIICLDLGTFCTKSFWQEVDYTSIEYLQSINQPFGTLRKETQEALKQYDNSNIEYYGHCKIWEPKIALYDMCNGNTYRLSPDYKEPSKGIEKLRETGILEFNSRQASEKINELIEASNEQRLLINKLMEER